MLTARDVEGDQTAADAVYAEASSVEDAAVALTPLLEATCPRHRHHRHLHHSCLESLQGPCAHVVVHTAYSISHVHSIFAIISSHIGSGQLFH